jgi:hypothetical protein
VDKPEIYTHKTACPVGLSSVLLPFLSCLPDRQVLLFFLCIQKKSKKASMLHNPNLIHKFGLVETPKDCA